MDNYSNNKMRNGGGGGSGPIRGGSNQAGKPNRSAPYGNLNHI